MSNWRQRITKSWCIKISKCVSTYVSYIWYILGMYKKYEEFVSIKIIHIHFLIHGHWCIEKMIHIAICIKFNYIILIHGSICIKKTIHGFIHGNITKIMNSDTCLCVYQIILIHVPSCIIFLIHMLCFWYILTYLLICIGICIHFFDTWFDTHTFWYRNIASEVLKKALQTDVPSKCRPIDSPHRA